MTDQELKDLVASFAVDHKETDRIVKENALQMKETDRRIQETDRMIKEFRDEMKELMDQTKEIGEQIGNVSNNIGFHAEQFFQDIFKRKLEFGRMRYDEMIPNLAYNGKKKIEFDIALLNGDSIALIEVKNRIHPDFVKKFAEERIELFRKYFQEFSNYRAYLGIAGFSFCDEVLDQASRYGIGIVKQVGEGVEIRADNLKAY